ncbi:hypothetical protein OEA41_000514 [Lepraria neglecta]|uniref:Uncharacterized protein n=1 Tax=Lepraria neglecta TaxID=209136 RepID=A0AAD9ZFS7_9LECA|nr:hypothetical protein OEA41_000514 [Lepraria neglecta]
MIRSDQEQQIARELSAEDTKVLAWLSPLEPRAKQLDVLNRAGAGKIVMSYIPSVENQFKNDHRVEVRASDEDVRAFVESEIAYQYQLVELLGGQGHLRGILVEFLLEKTKRM